MAARFAARIAATRAKMKQIKQRCASIAKVRQIVKPRNAPARVLLFAFSSVVFILSASAAEAMGTYLATYAEFLQHLSVLIASVAAAFISFLTIVSIVVREKSEAAKKMLFILMTISISFPTLFFIGATVYTNSFSETKGPVHWHADFEIYACGTRIALAPPASKLSNKVGTPVFHHHNDNRVHVEGVVVERARFSLADFFAAIGGRIDKESFTLPTDTGVKHIQNGELCNGNPGLWQTFVYEQDERTPSRYRQRKLQNVRDFVLAPFQNIPPGNCIIFEFDAYKERTDHLCAFYEVARTEGRITIE